MSAVFICKKCHGSLLKNGAQSVCPKCGPGIGQVLRPSKKEQAAARRERLEVLANRDRREAVEREERDGFSAVCARDRDEVIRFKVVRNAKKRWLHFSAGPGCPKEMHLDTINLGELIDKLIGARELLMHGIDSNVEVKLTKAEFERAPDELREAYIKRLPRYEQDYFRKLPRKP